MITRTEPARTRQGMRARSMRVCAFAATAAALVAGTALATAASSGAALVPLPPVQLPVSLPVVGGGTIPVVAAAGSAEPTLVGLGAASATTSGDAVLTVRPANAASDVPDVGLLLRLARLKSGGRSFEVSRVRCVGGADRVLYTVDGVRRLGPCGGRPALISRALTSGRLYNLDIEAVRMNGHKMVAGGVMHQGAIQVGPAHHGWAVTA